MELTIEDICRLCDVSPQVAERAMKHLIELGLVAEEPQVNCREIAQDAPENQG